MSLTDLKCAGQVSCRMSLNLDLSDVCLMIRPGGGFWGGRPQNWLSGTILITSYPGCVLSTWLVTVDVDLIAWCLPCVSTRKLFSSPSFPYHTLERSHNAKPTPMEQGFMLYLLEGGVSTKLTWPSSAWEIYLLFSI